MITAFAPAKVNLALHVTGQREDGYHLLDSLVVFADYGDLLFFSDASDRAMTVTGTFAEGVPTGPENLVWQAVELLDPDRGLHVELRKLLPHGAGIGGGSSDAGATLRALSRHWDMPMPAPERVLALGADVPACVDSRAARMSGIGERLEPVPQIPPFFMLLVNCGAHVPTGAVFRAMAKRDNPALAELDWHDHESFLTWLSRTRNDLESPATRIEPEILEVLRRLESLPGCRFARMSGSGATCFGLFFEIAELNEACRSLRADNPDWWVWPMHWDPLRDFS